MLGQAKFACQLNNDTDLGQLVTRELASHVILFGGTIQGTRDLESDRTCDFLLIRRRLLDRTPANFNMRERARRMIPHRRWPFASKASYGAIRQLLRRAALLTRADMIRQRVSDGQVGPRPPMYTPPLAFHGSRHLVLGMRADV